jgi:HEAT repeat protein
MLDRTSGADQDIVLRAIGGIGDPAALDPLIGHLTRYLADEESVALGGLVQAISGLAHPQAIPRMIEALADAPSEAARDAVLRAFADLRGIGDDLLDALLPRCTDPSEAVRGTVAQMLGPLTQQDELAAAALVSLLDDADPGVRRAAVEQVGLHLVEDGVEAAERLADGDDPDVRSAARLALQRIDLAQVRATPTRFPKDRIARKAEFQRINSRIARSVLRMGLRFFLRG